MKKEIYIVGGGHSLKTFDFTWLKGKDVIAVNHAVTNVPFAKYFISMDYTYIDKKADKEFFKSLSCQKFFVVSVNNKYIKYRNHHYYDARSNYVYDLSLFDRVIPAMFERGLSRDFMNFVHGCNSGYCAFQLALLLGYTDIHLLGFDMNVGETTHYHDHYGTSSRQFVKTLRIAVPIFIEGLKALKKICSKITVYNYSKTSPLTPYTKYRELYELYEGQLFYDI